MSSRTVHSSSVQVLLNASGKKSITAGPSFHSDASGTCSCVCDGSVTSGARSPTFSPIPRLPFLRESFSSPPVRSPPGFQPRRDGQRSDRWVYAPVGGPGRRRIRRRSAPSGLAAVDPQRRQGAAHRVALGGLLAGGAEVG